MNRFVDYENLKMQNFQLKNEITDLKNGFDLNRNVLQILQQQNKQVHPKLQIFYQVISKLTTINTQIMFNNTKTIEDKNKLIAEVTENLQQNKKLQLNLQNLAQKIETLTLSKDTFSPKQIHLEMRQQIKQLRSQILAINQQCLRKNIEISRLENIINTKNNQDLKKPIIATLQQSDHKFSLRQVQQIPKRHETNKLLKYTIINKNLQRQNTHLKRLVYELEYRLTLFARLYLNEQTFSKQPHQKNHLVSQEKPLEKVWRNQIQLGLLMFALENTKIVGEESKQNTKLTIGKKPAIVHSLTKKNKKCKSTIF